MEDPFLRKMLRWFPIGRGYHKSKKIWLPWEISKSIAELHVLSSVSVYALFIVPIIANIWPFFRWTFERDMPEVLAVAFFSSAGLLIGNLVFQYYAPPMVREFTIDGFSQNEVKKYKDNPLEATVQMYKRIILECYKLQSYGNLMLKDYFDIDITSVLSSKILDIQHGFNKEYRDKGIEVRMMTDEKVSFIKGKEIEIIAIGAKIAYMDKQYERRWASYLCVLLYGAAIAGVFTILISQTVLVLVQAGIVDPIGLESPL